MNELDKTKEKTAVIKVSGSLVTTKDPETGMLIPNDAFFHRLGRSAVNLAETHNLIVVSSGAIPRAMAHLGMKEKPKKSEEMPELQRLADIGNRLNANSYADALDESTAVGVVLLTRSELTEKSEEKARVNLMNTLRAHARHGDFVMANEDDARSYDEIMFGDNAILSAELGVALDEHGGFGAVDVVMLGRENGLLADISDENSVVEIVRDIDEAHEYIDDSVANELTNGGMEGKLEAAEILAMGGLDMVIANGNLESAVELALAGEIGTKFALNG